MDPAKLRALLERVQGGDASVDEALHDLADLPFRDLGFARVDHHRHLRTGFPEVVLGLGKTAEQIARDHGRAGAHRANVLATRVAEAHVETVLRAVPAARHEAVARAIVVEQAPIADVGRGTVLVIVGAGPATCRWRRRRR